MASHPSPALLLDDCGLEDYILGVLGMPQVKVELTQDDLDRSIDDAKHWFSARKGFKKNAAMQVISGQVEYALPEDVDTILNVSFPSPATDYSRMFDPLHLIDGYVPYSLFPAAQVGGLFSAYNQSLTYLEEGRRVMGTEPEWQQAGRILFIFPIPKYTGTMVIEYKSNRFSLNQLNERDHYMVKRYAVAQAKMKLGTLRSKYDQFAGAQSGISLDGLRLKEEARQEIEALTEEIAQSGFPLGFMCG